MHRLFFLVLSFLLTICAESKAPQLTPRDVKFKIEEILKSHAAYKKLTPELIERILTNFINELDPTKSYFLEEEITVWLHPSEELIQTILESFSRSDFTAFTQIHAILEQAIARRSEIEAEIDKQPLPANVKSDEFKELAFAKTRNELLNRCLRVKALQAEIAERLNEESRDIFLQRIQKRRLNREAEWLVNSDEKQKIILSCVMKATAESLDSHTNYFTPSEANQFMIQVQQRYLGSAPNCATISMAFL